MLFKGLVEQLFLLRAMSRRGAGGRTSRLLPRHYGEPALAQHLGKFLVQVPPSAHILRFSLYPDEPGLRRIARERGLQGFFRERVKLLDSDDRQLFSTKRLPTLLEIKVDFAAA